MVQIFNTQNFPILKMELNKIVARWPARAVAQFLSFCSPLIKGSGKIFHNTVL